MTEGQFRAYYDSDKYVAPYGDQVEEFAFVLLVHRDAARTIRHEVFKAAYQQCADFEPETAWAGDKKTGWEGLQAMTRACCLQMILLPCEENPLAKPEFVSIPETEQDLWYLSVSALPFEQRRVLFLSLFFRKNVKAIRNLLNKTAAEVKSLQARANEELAQLFLNVQKKRLQSFAEDYL